MRVHGLTLIELLVTLTVVVVIMLAGVPALQNLLMGQRMTAQINDFVHSVFLAKQSAHTRQTETVICKSSTGRRCEPGADWSDGWLMFANQDQDYPATVDANEPVLAIGDAFRHGNIHGNRREFVFRAFEIRSTNGTLVFCDARGAAHARAVVISYTGRPRIATTRPGGSPLRCPTL
ncbi:MAG: general secretion pathway protein GspH [Chromatiales bacterium]|nr:general secretion pathway protein GspH [Chromatiales bacterium]